MPFLTDDGFPQLLADLVLFVDVVRAGSLSQAAAVNGIALSTLSRRLTSLERSLGVRLIDRSTRRFKPTQEGERYANALGEIIMDARGAVETLASDGKALRGRLRISATPDFGTYYLGPIIGEFAHRHTEIEMVVDLSPRLTNLISEGVDVAVHMGDLPDSGLTVRRLARIANSLYAAPSYLADKPAPERPEDLTAHQCIALPHQRSQWILARANEKVTVAAVGKLSANNVSFIRHLGVAGHGIVCLGDLVAEPEVEQGRLVRVLPDWRPEPVTVSAVTASKLVSPRARSFIDFMSKRMAPLHLG